MKIGSAAFDPVSCLPSVFGLSNPTYTPTIKLEVKPADLKQLVFLAKALHFAGISVTMPLKEAIVDQLDVVEEQATLIGACNTIAFKQGKSFGYNTDAKAALDALEEIFVVKNSRLLILGAGGAANL